MDQKRPNQVPPIVLTPKSSQAQSALPATRGASSKTGGASNSGDEKDPIAEKDPITDDSAASTSEPGTRKQGGNLTAVLEASRAELDSLLAETHSIHERSWRVIQALLENSHLKAALAVDAGLIRFENETRDRLNSEMTVMLQNFDVEAGARLAARLDQALATAKQRQHSIEQDLATAVAENRKQLDQISTGAADGLQQRAQDLMADLQNEAERHRGELANNARRIADDLQQPSDKFAAELKRSIDEAVQLFQSRIEQTWQELVGRAEQRMAETANTQTAELAKQARQVVDREMSEFLSQALRRFERPAGAPSSNQGS